jgi:hypothetical protein
VSNKTILYGIRTAFVIAVFSAGVFCGVLTQQSASAQLGGLGEEVLNKAEESGGAIGTVARLGSAITDMEKHVSGLQQNLDTLKKVEAALHMGGK